MRDLWEGHKKGTGKEQEAGMSKPHVCPAMRGRENGMRGEGGDEGGLTGPMEKAR